MVAAEEDGIGAVEEEAGGVFEIGCRGIKDSQIHIRF
jgi:hypothetical protein